MKKMEPDGLMVPKIEFMEAVARGTQTNMTDFENQLKE